MCVKIDSGTNEQVNYKSFKIHVILKSYTCGSKSITTVTFLSQASAPLTYREYKLLHCTLASTGTSPTYCEFGSRPLRQSELTVIFLLLESLAFTLLRTQHLWSAIKLSIPVQSSLWHTAGRIVNLKKKGCSTAHFHYYCTIKGQVFLFPGVKLNQRMYVQYEDNSLS